MRRAVGLARHAIPAFIISHIGLVGHFANAQDVERAHIDTDAAAFFGNAFVVVDDDRDGAWLCCEWHTVFSVFHVIGLTRPRSGKDVGVRLRWMLRSGRAGEVFSCPERFET